MSDSEPTIRIRIDADRARAQLRVALAWLGAHTKRHLAAFGPEAAVALAFVAGWALVTLGIARLARPGVVWPLSIGLLFLSLAGWRVFVTVAWHGLYVLGASDRAWKKPAASANSKAAR